MHLVNKGEDNLHYWIERLGRPAEQITVFKVLPDGRMHTTSETHLSGDAESYLESVEKSRRYWREKLITLTSGDTLRRHNVS